MLSDGLRSTSAEFLRGATDEIVRRPLWDFPPLVVPLVQHERRRRFGLPTADDFDPEYS